MPIIGDSEPEFLAHTTNVIFKFQGYYAVKWVILFSHPADFTPVCTTEFMTFQSILSELQALNTEIIGLSVGTLTGHLAWIESIQNIEYNNWKNMTITFPIIDDINMSVAKKYGMIHSHASDNKTVRAVFFIDPKGVIRAILYYPLTTGRNFDEIKRVLIALQASDSFGISTPADWQPGKDVVIPAPSTTKEMEERLKNKDKNLDVKSWYLTMKKMPNETILNKLYSNAASKNIKK